MANTHRIIEKRQEIISVNFRLHRHTASSTIDFDAVNQLYKHVTFINMECYSYLIGAQNK